MTKHTPGPWAATRWQLFEPLCGVQIAVSANDRRAIALTGLEGDKDEAESRANARLIAAAPELLAALKQIRADWAAIGDERQAPDEINVNEHWDAVDAAIAKAEGR